MSLRTYEADLFERSRGRLEAIAYRLLGSAGDAEDAVQDTYLRWHAADRDLIETPEAWLTKVLTNLCLNQLTSARARRVTYVGQWLPEPLLTGDRLLGPADTFEQRESVSMAMLTLMERLSPNERAVYVLREAFGYPHREIAEILDLTEANCQQIHRRAKQHLASERTRTEVDAAAARRVVEEFLAAALSGDTEPLVRLLTGDAVSVADGGAKVAARRTPVVGALHVARYLRGLFRPSAAKRAQVGEGGRVALHAAVVNGGPAALIAVGERVLGIICLAPAPGGVGAVHIQVNPDKLERLTRSWAAAGPHRPLTEIW
ncbi:DNA-directed RNA polymerase sigma-70 factor [Kitasatospora herbaricolor]|uniref:RNA polymerase sigma factor SigJ n=1 Tax=Kitasatospora herbaricolor TaxID=68217 RepID=UPI00174AFA21|nr:RNA polymerase sigma factor SigJ [Kitasatospora herbaricolor]MDQ0306623.1 RNA polymerase sigma-70 factor (ECF subfamily) [Kitasatospora herbaricolor]GGV34040.1 DNA-directed RNA polymerase sigma-70 factor [Kitasatospora herbaricolor]